MRFVTSAPESLIFIIDKCMKFNLFQTSSSTHSVSLKILRMQRNVNVENDIQMEEDGNQSSTIKIQF